MSSDKPEEKGVTHARYDLDRKLSTKELNLLGNYLADLYGHKWNDIKEEKKPMNRYFIIGLVVFIIVILAAMRLGN